MAEDGAETANDHTAEDDTTAEDDSTAEDDTTAEDETRAEDDTATAEPDRTAGRGVDLSWARRQRRWAVAGAVLALVALGCAILSLIEYPTAPSAATWRLYLALVATGVLTLCCVVLVEGWRRGMRSWGDDSGEGAGMARLLRVCFGAHVVSYLTVLLAMYGSVAESALVGWNSGTGTLLGVVFIVVIGAQTIGGTQYLRRSGPPGTVPNYLRMLNAKVQSLR